MVGIRIRRLVAWLGRLGRPRHVARDMDDEFRFHVEMEALERLRQGESPAEARRRALVDFGGEARYRAAAREALGLRWLDDARGDARVALRSLRRRPAFAFVVIAILGLGIGANTAVFGILDRVLLRPLPYPDDGALVMLWQGTPSGRQWVSAPDYRDWSRELRGVDGVAAFTPDRFNVATAFSAETVSGASVSAEFFGVMRVAPALGRTFAGDEAVPGGPPVIVLSDALWRRQFGADPAIVGRSIDLEGAPATVLGVMPPGFAFPSGAEAWLPLRLFAQDWHERRGIDWLQVVARVSAGVPPEALGAELGRAGSLLATAYPETNAADRIEAVALREQLYGDLRAPVALLMGAVGFVLLMVCASVASLMISRATARRGEMAVRLALGSGRGRLVRAHLAESMVLALAGGAAGVFAAHWTGRALLALAPIPAGGFVDAGVDGRMLLFALLVTVLTGAVFGVAPALVGARAPLETALRASRGGDPPATRVARRALVIGQIAVAVVLVSGGSLLGRSLQRLREEDVGFNAERVLTARVSLTEANYPDDASRSAFFDRLRSRLAAVPGVEAVAIASQLPLTGSGITFSFALEQTAGGSPDDEPLAGFRMAGPGYFDALGIPIRRGRDFAAGDDGTAPLVVAIDETLAREHFPETDPLGRQIRVASEWRRVVAVVGPVRQSSLEASPVPTIYVPFAQRTGGSAALVVRGVAATPSAATLIDAAREVDPTQPVSLIRPMSEYVTAAAGEPRFLAFVIGAFAVSALIIAALGVYGVVVFAVSRRSREFGIRMALGAQPAVVTRAALRDGLVLLGVGLPIGVAAALGLARFLESVLYGVQTTDPVTFLIAPAVLCAVTLVAAWLPARRAARLDAVKVLRAE